MAPPQIRKVFSGFAPDLQIDLKGPCKATSRPPKIDEKDEEPEVQFCLHCRSETHRIEDCAAHKVAQAKRKKVWCEKCKQYGHTIADCLDEKQEQRK